MHANQMTVAGQPYIAFDAVGAFFEREFICGQRVFGASGRSAPVGYNKWMPGEHLVGPRHMTMLPSPPPATKPRQPMRAQQVYLRDLGSPRPSDAQAVRPVCSRSPRRPG